MIRVGSHSEIASFRRCSHQHDLNYKQCWLPAEISEALAKGTLWHLVLEAHYRYLWVCQQEKTKPTAEGLRAAVLPFLFDEETGEQSEMQTLIEWMYRGYVDLYGLDDQWKILGVEHAGELWLPTPRGTRSNFKIRMKLDLIVAEKRTNHIYLVDHKSGKDLPSDKMLEIDTQFALYTWGLRKMGKTVFGQIHDAARTLKYKDENKEQPLDERFKRTMMYRTDVQLNNIALDAYHSMRRAYQIKDGESERVWDSGPFGCRGCTYLEPCLMGSKGMDEAAALKEFGFHVGDPYERYR